MSAPSLTPEDRELLAAWRRICTRMSKRGRGGSDIRELLAAWRRICTDPGQVATWPPERRARAIELTRASQPWVYESIERLRREQEREDSEARAAARSTRGTT